MGGLSCVQGKCASSATACGDLQQPCTTMANCCSPLLCLNTVTETGAVAQSCCVNEGGACPNGDLDCCGYLLCNQATKKCVASDTGGGCLSNTDCISRDCDTSAGKCRAPSTGTTGRPVGAACDLGMDLECAGAAFCLNLASTMMPACCMLPGSDCVNPKDCCGYTTCGADKKCTSQQLGGNCLDSIECAGATTVCSPMHKCVQGGSTGMMTGTGTVPLGSSCTDAAQCANTGETDPVGCPGGLCCYLNPLLSCTSSLQCCGAMQCASNTSNANDPKVCCKNSGQACTSHLTGGSECCGSSLCVFGSCY
jgi:hypothetical protein